VLSSIANQPSAKEAIEQAADVVRLGGVVAYPTESCFGLGCDPNSVKAVERILRMKKRSRGKGVILVADRFERFVPFIEPLSEDLLCKMQAMWPGPNTWLCPARSSCSPWLKGDHDTLAIRVTAHWPAARLAQRAQTAVVSTSANVSSNPALTTAKAVRKTFGTLVDYVVDLPIGHDQKPSTIRNATTGEVIR